MAVLSLCVLSPQNTARRIANAEAYYIVNQGPESLHSKSRQTTTESTASSPDSQLKNPPCYDSKITVKNSVEIFVILYPACLQQ